MFNKETIKKHLINIRGKKIKEKFLVLESDDWGSIRIPNIEVRDILWQKGYTRRSEPFARFDTLETSDDYNALFTVLSQYKDKIGNNPVLTANFIMNNPDFDTIKKSDFQQYYSESFLETYQRYSNAENTWNILQQGIHQKLIKPQFHGAEHLNVVRWMNVLRQNDIRFKEAFDLNCYAIDDLKINNRRANLMAAYDFDSNEELSYIQKSIKAGLQQFQDVFQFSSQTTIAPCYVWNEDVEKEMKNNNVNCFQGSYQQNIPEIGKSFKKKYRYTGEYNDLNQIYLVRNGLFEPSLNNQIDWVQKCLESIAIAFHWGKPAVISMHRINFVGSLDVSQRDQNLKSFDMLLKNILQKWPDVHFIDSEELYENMLIQ